MTNYELEPGRMQIMNPQGTATGTFEAVELRGEVQYVKVAFPGGLKISFPYALLGRKYRIVEGADVKLKTQSENENILRRYILKMRENLEGHESVINFYERLVNFDPKKRPLIERIQEEVDQGKFVF